METDLESVPFTDKESDKISDTVRSDVEASKADVVEESFEFINNGDKVDTNKSADDHNVTEDELVSTSKDNIISLDSNVSLDTSHKTVDDPISNIEETETGQSTDNEPEQLLTEVIAEDDDDNLMDEIHNGSFNAASSPIASSSVHINTSVQSIEESYEMVENETVEEEHYDEQDIEEEEDEEEHVVKNRTNADNNDTIVLDDDDDDEDDIDEGDVDDVDSEDEDDRSENSDDDESLDGTDKEDNNDYDDHKDDDISTLSSDCEDVEMVSKVPDRKPKTVKRKKVVTVYKRLLKKSIKM